MALAPADFYAYSRATGTPYPEDPEERAEMAPAVAEFRRNQLKAPQQESNPLAAIGAVALGLGGLAGLGFGARRLLRAPQEVREAGRKLTDLPSAEAALKTAARYKPVDNTPPPSKTAIPQSTVDLSTFTNDAEFLKRLELEEAEAYSQIPEAQQEERRVTRFVQGIESKEKALAKNILLDLRRQEKTAAVPQATVDLTTIQEAQKPTVVNQQVAASDPGLDQVINRGVVIPEQREVNVNDFVRFSRDADRVEKINAVTEQIEKFPQEAVRATTASSLGNVWDLEDQLEEMGRQAQQYFGARYERGGRTVADLTGEIEVAPSLGKQLRQSGINVRGGRSVQLSQFSDAPTREGIGVNRFTPDELLQRTMASVSYPREIRDKILDPNTKLEELTPYLGTTTKIRGGAVSINPTMEIAGGARASMPDASVDELQTAGAGGVGLTYHDTTDLKQLQQKENLEKAGYTYDPNTGNYYSEYDDIEIDPTELMSRDPNMGSDYGDTEGVGNLLISTEAFKERTNQGTTRIPGTTQTMRGRAAGSEREERAVDAVIPFRRTAEGLETTGLETVPNPELPFGRQLRSRDVSYRQGKRLSSVDPSTQGSKLPGGFETSQANVSEVIDKMPVADWRSNSGVIKGDDGNLYSAPGMEVVGEAPLLGIKRTALTTADPTTGKPARSFITLKTAKLTPLSLPRQELQEVAEAAKDAYFNNPTAKLRYLEERNPEALQQRGAKPLSELGEPYDYQGFIAQKVDEYLMNNLGIDLPFLKPQVGKDGSVFLGKEASTFASNLLKTEKATSIYGKRFITDASGRKVPLRDENGKIVTNKGGYIVYATEEEKVPIPGRYEYSGGGGVDPMTIGEDYDEGNVAYFTPRIDTASQTKVLQLGKQLDIPASSMVGVTSNPIGVLASPLLAGTVTGGVMSGLRRQMETPQVGVGMRKVPVRNPLTGQKVGTERVSTMNIGSFARTQNPYTGPAAAAMGPVSRVSSGNYQYSEPQLKVNLEPTSQRQLQERNQFALAANLTPGGSVQAGALNLSGNLGTINAGVGGLTESETIQRYGLTGSQLQQFGRSLMDQAAQRRNLPSGPTSVRQRVPGNPLADYQNFAFADEYQRTLPLGGTLKTASPADTEAAQTEAYMRKLQRGRSTPLTSQAVIQPRLF